jgi:DNA repair exonuclease SbcCD ATPase subunit
MYKKLYEKNSTIVNKIIDETKQCLKNLYSPLKSLREDVKSYSNNFENSLNQLTIPLKNGKSGINDIDYAKYPKDKQNRFLKDRDEVIKEIDNFLKEANYFYLEYGQLNRATFEDIDNFVQRFNQLAVPAKELTTFMRSLMKAFEKSSSSFNDYKDKKKIDEVFKKIKEPINEFYNKSKNLENLLNSIKDIKIERINEMMTISKSIKEKISKLEERSKAISEKIKKIRVKYDEPEEKLDEVDMPAPNPVNSKKASDQIEEEGKKIGEKADIGVKDIKGDIDKIKSQTRLDLLFIMDITNSMDYYLNQVKQDILDIISKIQIECAGSDIYLGFIGYKDFNDLDLGDEYINLEFTTDYESIRKNIEFVTPGGGGDIPEDLCGGLELGKKKRLERKDKICNFSY